MTKDPSKEPTILVVDDREQNLQVVGATLAPFRYELVFATSGTQALELVEANRPDLIVLDIMLPDIDGLEVCRRLKKNPALECIPVIFLSAQTEKNLIVEALEAGAVDFITKPFNKAELLSRVRTHLELRDSQQRTELILNERENFIATLAHDLRNPLGGAKFGLELLIEKPKMDPETIRKVVSNSHEALGSALTLLDELLDDYAQASDVQKLSMEPLDFCEAVREVFRSHGERASRKNIALSLDCPEEDSHVIADRSALRRVLDNLISNAIKFTPPGKAISIEVDLNGPERLLCTVCDQGPGISPEEQGQLFQRFTRLSAKPTGGEPSTGLGLAIAFSLVASMNGGLHCESEVGKGSRFVLSMSRAPDHVGEDCDGEVCKA